MKKAMRTLPNLELRPPVLAVGLLVLAVLAVLAAVIVPVARVIGSAREETRDLQFSLNRYRAIAVQQDTWLDVLQELKDQQAEGSELLSDRATPALASADLQQFVKQAVEDAGGTLVSTQVLQPQNEESLTRFGVNVTMNGTMPMLREVLFAIDAERPLLFVTSLNLRPKYGFTAFNRNRSRTQQDQMHIDFELIGYMRGS